MELGIREKGPRGARRPPARDLDHHELGCAETTALEVVHSRDTIGCRELELSCRSASAHTHTHPPFLSIVQKSAYAKLERNELLA